MTDNPGRYDRETVEHILQCPSCSRVAEAANLLEQLMALRKEDKTAASLSEMRARVESMRQEEKLLERIMLQVKYQYNARPKLLTGLGFALVIFFFMTLVPFSYNGVVGYQLTVGGAAADRAVSAELLTAALATIGYKEISVTPLQKDTGWEYVIEKLPTPEDASQVVNVLTWLTGTRLNWTVEPVLAATSSPLYAQAVRKVAPEKREPIRMQVAGDSIFINGRNITRSLYSTQTSDHEIERELRTALAALGISDDEIAVNSLTDYDDNTRTVSLKLLADSSTLPTPDFEFLSRDGEAGAEIDGSYYDESTGYRHYKLQSSGGGKLTGRKIVLKIELKED